VLKDFTEEKFSWLAERLRASCLKCEKQFCLLAQPKWNHNQGVSAMSRHPRDVRILPASRDFH
jgi:hypothetical protein